MTSVRANPAIEMWRALGKIVPRVDSPDTLGITIATALLNTVGTGRAAVVLRQNPLERPRSTNDAATFFLRLVGDGSIPGNLVYLDGNHGILAGLCEIKDPLYLAHPWPATFLATDDPLLELAQERLVVVPIPSDNLGLALPVPGAICLLDVPDESLPTEAELISLASFTGVALSLLRSKALASRQSVEYSIISEIGRSLTSSLSLDDIFEKILSGVRAAIDASEVSVGLIDPATKDIIFEKSLFGPQFTAMPPLRLKMGQGVAGWVAKTGRPLNIPDAYQDPRFYPDVDAASGFVTRSILCVPLLVEEQVIGVMEVMNKRSGHFTDADQRLLSALASSAAIAIEKARLHADVLAEKRRMEAIFSTMGEGLMTVTVDGHITAVNPALQKIVEAESQELIGQDCRNAIQTEPNVLADLLETIGAKDTRKQALSSACDLIHPNGSRTSVLVSAAATGGERNDLSEVVIVFSDIGSIRELERMKEDFVANVTHELRTPLATILLYARLLRAGKAKHDPEREARYLEIVEQQSNQLQKLVRKILDLSRMDAILAHSHRDHIRLTPILVELLGPLTKLAHQKGLQIQIEIPPDLPPVIGNREIVHMIFGNLIDNAIKFTSQGEIQVRVRPGPSCVQVDVVDQGIGIAPEATPYLFQRFYRTEAAVERGIGGTGLGLALVKEAVEQLDGQVTVHSELDQGTTFSVTIPIAGADNTPCQS